jgi:hypothetical protein
MSGTPELVKDVVLKIDSGLEVPAQRDACPLGVPGDGPGGRSAARPLRPSCLAWLGLHSKEHQDEVGASMGGAGASERAS